ncbi:hypothetical protein [Sphingomonas sp.]|uniref:hypothetical protein n=1 Tax=Sphingomonas sp. TaxID=28214 RepID=UPI00307EB76B
MHLQLTGKDLELAVEVLRGAISSGVSRPLSPAERLACRVLLPVVEKRLLVSFTDWVTRGNPMYRESNLESAVTAIEARVRATLAGG